LPQLEATVYEAAKAVEKNIKVIVNVDEGNNNSKFKWFF
jgi:arabinogalactan endo-1,4-beta-galactosidase